MPCAAMAPPSLIDFILSRRLADGVVVAGCAESACYHRLGVAWIEQRFAGQRDPYLRARVPRERLATLWTSALATGQFEQELAAFRRDVATLAPMTPMTPMMPLRQEPARAPASTAMQQRMPATEEIGS